MRIYTDEPPYYKDVEDTKPTEKGNFVCLCGNDTFHIKYGDYVCIGVCTKCGVASEVYSG